MRKKRFWIFRSCHSGAKFLFSYFILCLYSCTYSVDDSLLCARLFFPTHSLARSLNNTTQKQKSIYFRSLTHYFRTHSKHTVTRSIYQYVNRIFFSRIAPIGQCKHQQQHVFRLFSLFLAHQSDNMRFVFISFKQFAISPQPTTNNNSHTTQKRAHNFNVLFCISRNYTVYHFYFALFSVFV